MDPIILAMVRGKYYTEFLLKKLKGERMKDAEEKAREIFREHMHCTSTTAGDWVLLGSCSPDEFIDSIAQALREAYASGQAEGFASGRREGLEEAARIVDRGILSTWGMARAIRALADQPSAPQRQRGHAGGGE